MKTNTTELIRISKTAIFFRPLALTLILAAAITASEAQDATTPAAQSTSATPNDSETLPHVDKSFMMKAARASTNEVALSQLAKSRASNQAVGPFAQMMITDHDQANSDLKALAMSKGIDISKPVAKGEVDNTSDLSIKSGADFDKAYAELMVSAHKGAVDLFKGEVENGKDPDVVAFAKKYVGTLSMHLEHAIELKKTVDQ